MLLGQLAADEDDMRREVRIRRPYFLHITQWGGYLDNTSTEAWYRAVGHKCPSEPQHRRTHYCDRELLRTIVSTITTISTSMPARRCKPHTSSKSSTDEARR